MLRFVQKDSKKEKAKQKAMIGGSGFRKQEWSLHSKCPSMVLVRKSATTASLLPELGPDVTTITTSHIFPEPVPVSRLLARLINPIATATSSILIGEGIQF